jgi:hypothetical protein
LQSSFINTMKIFCRLDFSISKVMKDQNTLQEREYNSIFKM